MEHQSFPIIIENNEGMVDFDQKIVSLIKNETRGNEAIRLLENANILNSLDSSGNSLLHIAAQYNNDDVVLYLIKSGITRIDAQNNLGKTPLIIAIENCAFESIAILVEANANILISDHSAKSALHWIVNVEWCDQLALLASILKRLESQCLGNCDVIADKLLDAKWPLYCAILLGNLKVTNIMLDRGCKIDAREAQYGRTALHVAVIWRDVKHVQFLLDSNADPNIKDVKQQTAISMVRGPVRDGKQTDERVQIIRSLVDRGAALVTTDATLSRSQVDNTLRFGNKEMIEILLQANLDLNRIEARHNTPVHILASNEASDVFKALVGYTFNVDSRNAYLETPLSIAASLSNTSAVGFLLERGADVNAVNSRGCSPLYRCVERCSLHSEMQRKRCIQLLLENGADVALQTRLNRYTVFDVVRINKTYIIVALLLAHVALQEALGMPVAEIIDNQIYSHSPFEIYYNFCKQQLTIELYESVMLLNLLSESDIEFECHVRNQELASSIEKFNDERQMSLYYFNALLQKRYSKVRQLTKLRKEAAYHFFQIIKADSTRYPAIADQIVSYLEEKDLQNILKVSL